VQALIVVLVDFLDPAHEVREVLELGPLVVGRGHRYVDLNGLLDLGGHR
jgi:hypothetical protein